MIKYARGILLSCLILSFNLEAPVDRRFNEFMNQVYDQAINVGAEEAVQQRFCPFQGTVTDAHVLLAAFLCNCHGEVHTGSIFDNCKNQWLQRFASSDKEMQNKIQNVVVTELKSRQHGTKDLIDIQK